MFKILLAGGDVANDYSLNYGLALYSGKFDVYPVLRGKRTYCSATIVN